MGIYVDVNGNQKSGIWEFGKNIKWTEEPTQKQNDPNLNQKDTND